MFDYKDMETTPDGVPRRNSLLGLILTVMHLDENLHVRKDIINTAIDFTDIPNNVRNKRKSGDNILEKRMGNAIVLLHNLKCIDRIDTGIYKLTDLGKKLVDQHQDGITLEVLQSLPTWKTSIKNQAHGRGQKNKSNQAKENSTLLDDFFAEPSKSSRNAFIDSTKPASAKDNHQNDVFIGLDDNSDNSRLNSDMNFDDLVKTVNLFDDDTSVSGTTNPSRPHLQRVSKAPVPKLPSPVLHEATNIFNKRHMSKREAYDLAVTITDWAHDIAVNLDQHTLMIEPISAAERLPAKIKHFNPDGKFVGKLKNTPDDVIVITGIAGDGHQSILLMYNDNHELTFSLVTLEKDDCHVDLDTYFDELLRQ